MRALIPAAATFVLAVLGTAHLLHAHIMLYAILIIALVVGYLVMSDLLRVERERTAEALDHSADMQAAFLGESDRARSANRRADTAETIIGDLKALAERDAQANAEENAELLSRAKADADVMVEMSKKHDTEVSMITDWWLENEAMLDMLAEASWDDFMALGQGR